MHNESSHPDQGTRTEAIRRRRVSASAEQSPRELVFELRRANLKRLIAEASGVQRLAEIADRSHSQISQISQRIPYVRAGKAMHRQMGDKFARHLEQATGKPLGWMDRDNTMELPAMSVEAQELAAAIDRISEPERRRAVLDICRAAVELASGGDRVG